MGYKDCFGYLKSLGYRALKVDEESPRMERASGGGIEGLQSDEHGQVELQDIQVNGEYSDIAPYSGDVQGIAVETGADVGEPKTEKVIKQDRIAQKDVVKVAVVAFIALIVVLVFVFK